MTAPKHHFDPGLFNHTASSASLVSCQLLSHGWHGFTLCSQIWDQSTVGMDDRLTVEYLLEDPPLGFSYSCVDNALNRISILILTTGNVDQPLICTCAKEDFHSSMLICLRLMIVILRTHSPTIVYLPAVSFHINVWHLQRCCRASSGA